MPLRRDLRLWRWGPAVCASASLLLLCSMLPEPSDGPLEPPEIEASSPAPSPCLYCSFRFVMYACALLSNVHSTLDTTLQQKPGKSTVTMKIGSFFPSTTFTAIRMHD